jgi:hypothetical protein
LSPDKEWEYKDAQILNADTTQVVLDIERALDIYGPETELLWAPDSKRFGFNYSPLHAHHTTYKKVVFYQVRGDKWVALHSPADALQPSQLLQPPLKDHLPKGFNPRHCAPEWVEVKLRTWTDADTAILYAPCYDRSSDRFPLHVKVQRCWQLEDHQNASDVEKGARRRTMRSLITFVATCTIGCCFVNAKEILPEEEHDD